MTAISNNQVAIIRTERGMRILSTRITIYDVMDFLKAHYPPKLIRDRFNLTDAQINSALSYIETNRSQIEAEYQKVLHTREEIHQYWEDSNSEYFAYLATKPHKPGQEALWAKLEQQKSDRASVMV